MTWYEFAIPSVVIALLVRLEAILIGPYWAWIELLPFNDEGKSTTRQRRSALLRRVAIPGVVVFFVTSGWPDVYGLADSVIVASGAVGLLLWPILWVGAPTGVSRVHLAGIYLSLLLAFCASALLGRYVALFAQRHGGIWAFLEENLIGIIISTVIALFFTGTLDRLSRSASRQRQESSDE